MKSSSICNLTCGYLSLAHIVLFNTCHELTEASVDRNSILKMSYVLADVLIQNMKMFVKAH